MYPPVAPEPPESSGTRSARRPPGWGGLLVAAAVAGAIPVVLWAAENPVAGAVLLVGVGTAVAAAIRRAERLGGTARARVDGVEASVDDWSGPTSLDARASGPPADAR